MKWSARHTWENNKDFGLRILELRIADFGLNA